MNLHPFDTVVGNAKRKMAEGWKVYQQWNCTHCGVKQTMPDENKFFLSGRCEECGRLSNIKKHGCNFMAVSDGTFDGLASLRKDMAKKGS